MDFKFSSYPQQRLLGVVAGGGEGPNHAMKFLRLPSKQVPMPVRQLGVVQKLRVVATKGRRDKPNKLME